MRTLAPLLPLLAISCLAAGLSQPLPSFRMANGLQVVLEEDHGLPLIRLELRVAWAASEEPAGKAGLGELLGQLLASGGAGPWSRAEFLRSLGDRALDYRFTAGPTFFQWSMLADSQGQDGAFEHLAHGAFRPVWDIAAAEAMRQKLLQDLKGRSFRERSLARFLQSLSPEGALAPTEASLGRIRAEDVRHFYLRVVRPERAVLVIRGDLSLAQARQLAYLHLGVWGPEPQKTLQGIDLSPEVPAQLWVALESGRRPEAWIGACRKPETPRMALVQAFLRFWLQRQDLGDIQLQAPGRSEEGHCLIFRLQVAPEVGGDGALVRLRSILSGLPKTPISVASLARAKVAWRSRELVRMLHPAEHVDALAQQVLAGGDPLRDVETITPEELLRGLAAWLSPASMRCFIYGIRLEDLPRLQALGLGIPLMLKAD